MDEYECKTHLKSIGKQFFTNGLGCNGTFDTLLCWEATAANTTLSQKCPELKGFLDSSKTVYKYCTKYGFWENSDSPESNVSLTPAGKTDFRKYCLSDSAQLFDEHLKDGGALIYEINRYVELGGLCLSFFSIIVSLFIFFYFKSLVRNQTKIHINLFVAMLLQVTVRFIIYIDQLLDKGGKDKSFEGVGAISENIPGFCQTLYILLQFSLSSMFMWMLIEGFYLNLLLMNAMFDENKHHVLRWLYLIGWGLPVILVLPWVVVMLVKIGVKKTCWVGYDKFVYYWILQGPRFLLMAVNLFFLINVIRILITKLRDDRTESTKMVKKGLKAAILLFPLLGIGYIFNFIDPPKNQILSGIFLISATTLLMYQGFFVSLLYCFLNNEVKKVIKRFWINKVRMPRRMRTDINGRNNGRSKPLLLNGEQRNFTIVDQARKKKKNRSLKNEVEI